MAFLLTAVLAFHTLLAGGPVLAADGDTEAPLKLELTAEGSTATLTMTSTAAIEAFGGYKTGSNGVTIDEIFTYVSAVAFGDKDIFNSSRNLLSFGASGDDVAADTVMLTMVFDLDTAAYVKGETYSITIAFSKIFNADGEPYDWSPVTLTASLHEHAYGTDPAWTWAADNSTATATFTCISDDDIQDVDATVTPQTTSATCTEDGKTVYTATAEFDADGDGETETYTDTKEVKIDKLGHKWGDAEFTWADDGKSATAVRTCENDTSHKDNATVTIESAVKTPATCEGKGTTTYTATAVFSDGTTVTDTKDVTDIDALGHKWGAAEFTWADDGKSATAVRTCENDTSHKDNATVTIESAVKTPATCETAGSTTYTATATFSDGTSITDTKDVEGDIPALGHKWGEAEFTWAEDGKSATATKTCENDSSHVLTAEVTVQGVVTTPATCEGKGTTTYTATATFTDGTTATATKEVQDVPATGHDWDYENIVWNWTSTSDGYDVTATLTCKNDESHTLELDATVTGPENGTYTATVTGPDGNTYTDTKTGHRIIVTNLTVSDDTGIASAATDIDPNELYKDGPVTFTVTNSLPMDIWDEPVDSGCVVAIDNEDGTYTRLTCTTTDGVHSFTVQMAGKDIKLVVLLKGDANLDGIIDAIDTSFIKQTALDRKELNALQTLAADIFIDEDDDPDTIDAVDVSFIKQACLGRKILAW